MTAGSVIRRDYDWALSALSALGALASALLLLRAGPHVDPASHRRVGLLYAASADVRRRPQGTLVWQNLRPGDALYAQDAIFVPPGSGAGLQFEDGSELDVDENSLLVLESQHEEIGLLKGGVAAASGERALTLRTAQGAVELSSASEARLSVADGDRADLAVVTGRARLQTKQSARVLEASQRAQVGRGGTVRDAAPLLAQLSSPSRQARLYFWQASPKVTSLAWSSSTAGLTLQIATDPKFHRVIHSGPAPAHGKMTFAAPSAGRYWWRLVDERGDGVSDERSFTWIENAPPSLLSPSSGEQVYADQGPGVVLRWTPVTGVKRYRVEVSDAPDFASPRVEAVEDTRFVLPNPTTEGDYLWRVRADERERGESPFSQQGRFQFLLKPLPSAPELMKPEIEVSPARPEP